MTKLLLVHGQSLLSVQGELINILLSVQRKYIWYAKYIYNYTISMHRMCCRCDLI